MLTTERLCSSPLSALPDFLLRLPAGDTWIFVVIHGGCNNLGSVSSRQHKEPTVKGKASFNSKASFLFPVLKKQGSKLLPLKELQPEAVLMPLLAAPKLITPTEQKDPT